MYLVKPFRFTDGMDVKAYLPSVTSCLPLYLICLVLCRMMYYVYFSALNSWSDGKGDIPLLLLLFGKWTMVYIK